MKFEIPDIPPIPPFPKMPEFVPQMSSEQIERWLRAWETIAKAAELFASKWHK